MWAGAIVLAAALAAGSPTAESAQDPNDSDARVRHGQALLEAGEPDQAAREFEAADRIRPDDRETLRGLALAYSGFGDPRGSELFERLLGKFPEDNGLRAQFVDSLWATGQQERGNSEMERLLKIVPRGDVRRAYGLKLFGQGDFRKAEEQLSRAKAEGQTDADLLFSLGCSELENGRFDEAERTLAEAVAARSTRADAHHVLGQLLLLRGESARAAEELSKAAGLQPEASTIQLDLASALAATGNLESALLADRRAVSAEPQAARTHVALGTLLARMGRAEEANREIAESKRLFQRDQDQLRESASNAAILAQARTLLDSGRAAEALDAYRRLPGDASALAGAARALQKLGRRADALETLEKARLLAPDDRNLRYQIESAREPDRP